MFAKTCLIDSKISTNFSQENHSCQRKFEYVFTRCLLPKPFGQTELGKTAKCIMISSLWHSVTAVNTSNQGVLSQTDETVTPIHPLTLFFQSLPEESTHINHTLPPSLLQYLMRYLQRFPSDLQQKSGSKPFFFQI